MLNLLYIVRSFVFELRAHPKGWALVIYSKYQTYGYAALGIKQATEMLITLADGLIETTGKSYRLPN